MLIDSLFRLRRWYWRNLFINVSALLLSPLKMVGAIPFRLFEGTGVVMVTFTNMAASGAGTGAEWVTGVMALIESIVGSGMMMGGLNRGKGALLLLCVSWLSGCWGLLVVQYPRLKMLLMSMARLAWVKCCRFQTESLNHWLLMNSMGLSEFLGLWCWGM